LPPTEKEITAEQNKRLEKLLGSLLFYGMAIDGTMLTAINSIAVAKKHGMRETVEAMTQLLDYAATHPNAAITFFPSDMILHIHSDASYLSEPEAKSRFGGYFFLSSKLMDDNGNMKPEPLRNSAIHVISKLLKNVVVSAT
jgi:hypothetical protein